MTRGTFGAIALALSTLLACSDTGAGTLPSGSPTATVTLSPTPSLTVTPTKTQVKEAIQHYISALNDALREPQRADRIVAPLIAPECSCRRILDVLHDLAQEGHWLDYRYTVRDIRIQQVGSAGASATYSVTQSRGNERDREGNIVQSYAASTTRYSVHFRIDGGRWLLDRSDVMR